MNRLRSNGGRFSWSRMYAR